MANDLFEQYYAEKIWESIPYIYRHEDGLQSNPGMLRAMVQVIARQAAVLRRSQDRLWEDQFISWCSEWAVPYIGDLVGTRMLSALNKRGRRIDVAKTIYYRRRKGTPRVLEELIADISGWNGKLSEQFVRLARARHGLDAKPLPLAGRYSGTMPGGWADLRHPRISELANGPFEEFFHTPDTRRHEGLNGRYNIPKLAFFLYRIPAFAVQHSTPFALGDGLGFTFDPSGRDIPLFSKRMQPSDWDQWRSAAEWELAAPIPCRLLNDAVYRITGQVIDALQDAGLSAAAATDLGLLNGLRYKSEGSFLQMLNSLTHAAEITSPANLSLLLALALVQDCGKQALLPTGATMGADPLETNAMLVALVNGGVTVISAEETAAGNLQNWSPLSTKRLTIDAENGRLLFNTLPSADLEVSCSYHYGFPAYLGAGTYDRAAVKRSTPTQLKTGGGNIVAAELPGDGVLQIDDSKTYGPIANKLSLSNMTVQAANLHRPYLRLESNWILNTGSNEDANLILDGLWLGGAGNQTNSVILRGNYECVIIRHCNFDPGGAQNIRGEAIHPLALSIDGFVEKLCIESSIMGPIAMTGSGTVEEVFICDSILQSVNAAVPALSIDEGVVTMERCTVLGSIAVHELFATETILTQTSSVVNTQNGCFRFGAAPGNSRLPKPYESFLFDTDTHHWFTSQSFGHYAYAQLSETAPVEVRAGAANGSEMGAYSQLLNPIKLQGLKTKIDEYMPFGLIPIFINKT